MRERIKHLPLSQNSEQAKTAIETTRIYIYIKLCHVIYIHQTHIQHTYHARPTKKLSFTLSLSLSFFLYFARVLYTHILIMGAFYARKNTPITRELKMFVLLLCVLCVFLLWCFIRFTKIHSSRFHSARRLAYSIAPLYRFESPHHFKVQPRHTNRNHYGANHLSSAHDGREWEYAKQQFITCALVTIVSSSKTQNE